MTHRGTPGSQSTSHPGDCSRFLASIHVRHELDSEDRRAFHRHHESCSDCRMRLVEVERLDDLLLGWRAPPPSAGMVHSVLQHLQGTIATQCEDFLEDLHHSVAGDLEPWREEILQFHLQQCPSCEEALREADELRRLWQGWSPPSRRPEQSCSMAEAVLETLQRERLGNTAPAAGSRTQRFLGGIRVPRAAAALLLFASLLAAIHFGQEWTTKHRRAAPQKSRETAVLQDALRQDAVLQNAVLQNAVLQNAVMTPAPVMVPAVPVANFDRPLGSFEVSRRLTRAVDASEKLRTRPGSILRNAHE